MDEAVSHETPGAPSLRLVRSDEAGAGTACAHRRVGDPGGRRRFQPSGVSPRQRLFPRLRGDSDGAPDNRHGSVSPLGLRHVRQTRGSVCTTSACAEYEDTFALKWVLS